MRAIIPLFLLFLFSACASWSGMKQEDPQEPLILTFQSGDWQGDQIMLTYTLSNSTSQPITILGPRPVEPYADFVPGYVPPEFFQLSVTPWEALCQYAPTNSGTTDVKTLDDFLIVPAKGSLELTINGDHFDAGVCDDDVEELQVSLKYRFREGFLDKTTFERRVKDKGQLSQERSDALFAKLQEVYRQNIYSDTVTISRY